MANKQRLECVGIALHPDVIKDLDSLAAAKAVSRSELIRISVAIGLPLLKLGISVNTRRFLAIQEYGQLALSMMVERQYPEDHKQLLDMAFRNVEQYHG